ncbi:MAG TPA: tetratricopeptide repeat protein [Methanoregula sp.]|nr:tetratricopeptide repeat protein [Methanoregula sp.]
MNLGKFPTILAIILLTILVVQPALSANNVTIINQTADLEKDNATSFFNNAQRLLAACRADVPCDYETAIRLFDQALASNTTMIRKTDAILYLYQGKAYAQIQLEQYADAVATADNGLALYPEDAMLWNNRGYALSLLGRNQEALAAYDKSVTFDRNYTTAYINKGDILSQMGRYSDAAAAYTRANETDPFNIAASEGLEAARKGEATSSQTMTIIMAVVLVAAAGIAFWFVKIRKPAEPAQEEKKKRARKK